MMAANTCTHRRISSIHSFGSKCIGSFLDHCNDLDLKNRAVASPPEPWAPPHPDPLPPLRGGEGETLLRLGSRSSQCLFAVLSYRLPKASSSTARRKSASACVMHIGGAKRIVWP